MRVPAIDLFLIAGSYSLSVGSVKTDAWKDESGKGFSGGISAAKLQPGHGAKVTGMSISNVVHLIGTSWRITDKRFLPVVEPRQSSTPDLSVRLLAPDTSLFVNLTSLGNCFSPNCNSTRT